MKSKDIPKTVIVERLPAGEKIHLICRPHLPGDEGEEHLPGTLLRECSECRHPVWVAPTGQELERKRRAALLCVPCGLKHAQVEKVKEIRILRAQIEEISDYRQALRRRRAN